MRILTFTDFMFPEYLGGSARFATDLMDALAFDGHEVAAITRPSRGVYAGNPIRRNQKSVFKLLFFVFRSDLIFSHHPVFACLVALFFPQKLVYFFHGPFAEEYKSKKGKHALGFYIRFLLERFVLWRCKKVIVVSEYMAQKISRFRKKVVDLGPIQRFNDGSSRINFDCNVKEKYRCLVVRRLTRRTGVADLLQIAMGSNRVNLTVVGSGELKDALFAKYSGTVEFHSKITDEYLKELYCQSDVILLPSLDLEGFGLVILEAMSAGKPVLVSDTSGGAYDFFVRLGISTFLEMGSDTFEDLDVKIDRLFSEFNDVLLQEKVQSAFKESYYIGYGRRLLNVLSS